MSLLDEYVESIKVKQTLNNNCTSACIAMMLGECQSVVNKEFHELFHNKEITPTQYIRSKDRAVYECDQYEEPDPTIGNVYLLTVPSINVTTGLHHIVAIGAGEDGFYILDPNEGKAGKFYYTNLDHKAEEVGKAVKLGGFIPELKIHNPEIVRIYKEMSKDGN